MNKIIVFLATILSFVACSNSNIDNQNNLDQKTIPILEKCEVITVFQRTGKLLFTDTLTNNHIIYTEKGACEYALKNIPQKVFDTSEKYTVINEYFNRGEKTHEDQYIIYFNGRFSEKTVIWNWKRNSEQNQTLQRDY